MKKKYIQPSSEIINIYTEGSVAVAVGVYGSGGDGTMLSGKEEFKGGWNSSDWSKNDEE